MSELSPPVGQGGRILIAGAGVGGLACALACARAGLDVSVYEKTHRLSEVGAGIQLGPNAMRLLQSWQVEKFLRPSLVFPPRLVVRDAKRGRELAVLALGEDMTQRYGSPYGVIHRSDLQDGLSQAVAAIGSVQLVLGAPVQTYQLHKQAVGLAFVGRADAQGSVLIGADGLWSHVRQLMKGDGLPRRTGHMAYRALIAQANLPEALRSQDITVWMGPGLHMVHYPVRGGEWLNIVVIVEGKQAVDPPSWDEAARAGDFQSRLAGLSPRVQDLLGEVEQWRRWSLCDRPPVRSAGDLVQGRVGLIGDAAHPMLPYLAQGAAMAMEDAHALASSLGQSRRAGQDDASALQAYALRRWQRQARVQQRARRNATLFHASGTLAWSRDLALRWLGPWLLDMPWLYGKSD